MNRRNFLKSFAAAVGTVAVLGVHRLQIADGAGREKESDGALVQQIWAVNTSGGGYMHSQELSGELRRALSPTTAFRAFRATA